MVFKSVSKNIDIDKSLVKYAIDFEKKHCENYRKISNKKLNDLVYLNGKIPVLITAPHSTNHIREGKLKQFETFTACIVSILNSKADCNSLYTNCLSDIDPNYYDNCAFKQKINDIVNSKKIKLIIDIHGTGENRKYDIYPGLGNNFEFLLGNNHLFKLLERTAKENNISIGSLNKFKAVKQNTVTKFGARILKVSSLQLEINKKLRKPKDDPDKFIDLINFLSDFASLSIEHLAKKRNE